MEELVKTVTLHLAWGVELMTAAIIGYASVRAFYSYSKGIFKYHPRSEIIPKEEIRLSMGRTLALALELLLGADILKTAVAPTWNDIGQLASIAVLRTALNFFLEREMRQMERRDPDAHDKTKHVE